MNAAVYLGYDAREPDAYALAQASLLGHCPSAHVHKLDIQRLASNGLLRRPTDRRGQRYDILSNAPASTEFAISRFLVPLLCQEGWALFADSDVIFMSDVRELFARVDDRYALMCVQHPSLIGPDTKMDGQVQTVYPRKNWSSVMLFNCDHPANLRLSLQDVQERRGRDLHAFYWLADSEIGALPAEWNWLVGIQTMPAQPKIAHFTLGGPFTLGWRGGDHDTLWYQEQRRWLRQNSALEPVSRASSTNSHGAVA